VGAGSAGCGAGDEAVAAPAAAETWLRAALAWCASSAEALEPRCASASLSASSGRGARSGVALMRRETAGCGAGAGAAVEAAALVETDEESGEGDEESGARVLLLRRVPEVREVEEAAAVDEAVPGGLGMEAECAAWSVR